jgi:N-acetylmuramoyl-L-alanine amidase
MTYIKEWGIKGGSMRKLIGFWILVINSMQVLCITNQASCTINQIFHHRTTSNQDVPVIELGSVVLYTDKDIVLKESKKNDGNVERISFIIPGKLSDQANAMLKDIHIVSSNYNFNFEKSSEGLKLIFSFDPAKVGMTVDTFNSIKRSKGITFRLYNRDLLQKISLHKPIIQTVHNTYPTIFVDCGHGGSDSGAIGYRQIKEKDINLSIGNELAQQLKKKGLNVLTSRDIDCFVPLDIRTTVANQKNADLFISIHANSGKQEASGIETYCLEPCLYSLAQSYLSHDEHLYVKKKFYEKCKKSTDLAHAVHTTLISSLSHHGIINRHVRHQVAQVLHGATMPAILIEVGYITHEQEALLLADTAYQKKIAAGIVAGVLSYLGRS